ncbi:hypothetical protein D3C73_743970 [compost metagenome]
MDTITLTHKGGHLNHRLINRPGSAAAAYHKHNCAALGNTERCKAALGACSSDRSRPGIAGVNDMFASGKSRFCSFKADSNRIGVTAEKTVGQPRNRVLFMDQGRNAQLRGRIHDRSAHITACANHNIRLEFPEHFLGGFDPFEKTHYRLHIVHGKLAAEAGNIYRLEWKILIRNQLALQTPLSANIQEGRVFFFCLKLPGNGDSGIDMSPCAAAA